MLCPPANQPFLPAKQVFAALPHSIAFDIEIKMTTPHTQMHTDPAEIDRVLGATLATVDAALVAQPRLVVFSSFDPDVCLELRRRCTASAASRCL
jgi:glycerophosphodiester phosphodiesterase